MNNRSAPVIVGLALAITPPVFADSFPDTAKADRAVEAFMKKYNAPGISIAMARNGDFVFTRAYGMADRDKKIPLTPKHRLRIASISKPLTSIGIMRLVEEGKLALDDRIFGSGSILGADFPTAPDAFANRLTVRTLLEHRAGKTWSNKGADPMFLNREMNHRQLIRWVLEKRPLDESVGQEYHYSNFGYCLLGRVIEKKTGTSYPEFMQRTVFRPSGAASFVIAQNGGRRHPGEAQSYSQEKGQPDGFNVSRMDAHGGWVATPADIVRVLLRVDNHPAPRDLLKPESIATMSSPSKPNKNYALGWSVNKFRNCWHGGSLPGQGSIAARIHDGYCWAAIVNTRKGKMNGDLDRLLWQVRRALETRDDPAN